MLKLKVYHHPHTLFSNDNSPETNTMCQVFYTLLLQLSFTSTKHKKQIIRPSSCVHCHFLDCLSWNILTVVVQ